MTELKIFIKELEENSETFNNKFQDKKMLILGLKELNDVIGMKKIKSGSIVNLSSVSWMLGEGDKVVYETAKSAVIGLTRSFAQEFGKYNIRTNSVIPGSIATERQIKNWLTPKYKKLILDSQALKRQLKPDDVARLVLFLSIFRLYETKLYNRCGNNLILSLLQNL